MNVLAELNWLAIVVATIVSFVIGFLWYGPVFGKAWLAALGKTEDEIQPSPTPFIVSIVTALITCVTMALLIHWLGCDTWMEGVGIGLLTGIGFIAASMFSDGAFCGWSWTLVVIQSGYRVLYSVVMAVILVLWT